MIGQTLTHFRITAKLGEGGMGTVYRAEDSKLGRQVAIKVLPKEFTTDPERLARFQREAKTLASLNHPGIVAIFSLESADVTEDPSSATATREGASPSPTQISFLVMELVEGKTLGEVVPEGGVSSEQFFDLAIPLAETLAAAHEHGIVHRDLKPNNIMVTPSGAIKVLDFGLAKRSNSVMEVSEATATETYDQLTQENQIVGTVPYMSPEQLRAGAIDHRSDIFSLGIILYEMIGGRRPFQGESQLDLIFSILKEQPPSLTDLRPDIGGDTVAMVARCIEKEPDSRFDSALDLLDQLQGLREATSDSSGRSDSEGDSSVSRRRRALDPRAVAVLPLSILGGNQETGFLATGLHNDLITELSRIQGLTIISRASVMAYSDTEKTPPEIAHELNVGTLIQGTLQSAGSRVRVTAQLIDAVEDVQRWAERYDRELSTETLFDLQSDVTRKIVDSLQSELAPTLEIPAGKAPTHDLEAYRLVTLGRVQVERRTANGCERAIEHFRSAVERDPNYAPAWSGLGEALAISVWYGYSEPGDRLERARRAAERAIELDPDSAEAHGSMAAYLGAVRNGPEAIRELELAIELQPSYWEAHNLLSYLHHLNGQANKSLESARRAVELNPLSAEAVNHLSLAMLSIGESEKALIEARRAGELSPGWSTATFYEALALYELGQHAQAASLLENLPVEWAGQGSQATVALAHLGAGNQEAARQILTRMDHDVDAFAAGLVQLALGETEMAFESFAAARELNDWACLAVHHLYPGVWTAIARDSRFQDLVRRAFESHRFEVPQGDVHD